MNTKENAPSTKHGKIRNPTRPEPQNVSFLTGGWVVLQPEVDVLLDTKAKASSVGEVLALELVLLHLESSLKDLQRLVTAYLREARPEKKQPKHQ